MGFYESRMTIVVRFFIVPMDYSEKSWPNPVNVGLSVEYLKDRVWEYYDGEGFCLCQDTYNVEIFTKSYSDNS